MFNVIAYLANGTSPNCKRQIDLRGLKNGLQGRKEKMMQNSDTTKYQCYGLMDVYYLSAHSNISLDGICFHPVVDPLACK